MTENRRLKKRVRARADRTGESYTTALQHFRTTETGSNASRRLRIAVAQVQSPTDPGAAEAIRHAGSTVRDLMSEAHRREATAIHFGEGTLCAPEKRRMSSVAGAIAESDWSRFDWDGQTRELRLIADHAAALGLWTVIGGVHRLTSPRRPHNSMYVIDGKGQVACRYDERMLSFTKQSYMYTPGSRPVTFSVDGVRFGCALGMESVYPEVFLEYERADVDCVLFSSHGPSSAFSLQVQGHAGANSLCVSYATSCPENAVGAQSGIAGVDGNWIARCADTAEPAIALADIDTGAENPARPWRREARANHRNNPLLDDPRAADNSF